MAGAAAAMALTAHLNYYTAEGMVFMNGGYSGAAIASFTDAISHDPKDLHAYELRAWEYGSMGAYDREVADLNHAIALAPPDSRLYGRRALAKDDAADYTGAMPIIAKLSNYGPTIPSSRTGSSGCSPPVPTLTSATAGAHSTWPGRRRTGADGTTAR